MAHYCPKKEQRIFPEICKVLCPNEWERRIQMNPEGSIECGFKTAEMKRSEAHLTLRRYKAREKPMEA